MCCWLVVIIGSTVACATVPAKEQPAESREAAESWKLAFVRIAERNDIEAARLLREAWHSSRKAEDGDSDPYILAGMGVIAVMNDDPLRAARLFGASQAARAAHPAEPNPAEDLEIAEYTKIARSRLRDAAFDIESNRGRAMKRKDALALAMDQSHLRAVGTYAVWLCKNVCTAGDTAHSDVSGFVVLSSGTLDLGSLPQRDLKRIRDESTFLLWDKVATACFSLTTHRKNVMMAGIIPRGLTRWSMRGDTLRTTLYASPDAFYTLRAVLQRETLNGRGSDSGFIMAAFDDDAGSVYARRIGDEDASVCFPGSR